MTNVWVVTVVEEDKEYFMLGVFTSKEKAEQVRKDYIVYCFEDGTNISQWVIEIRKMNLDEPFPWNE